MMGTSKRLQDLETRLTALEAAVVRTQNYSRDQIALSDQLRKLSQAVVVCDTERSVARIELAKALGLLKLLGLAQFPQGVEGAASAIQAANLDLEKLVRERLELIKKVAEQAQEVQS